MNNVNYSVLMSVYYKEKAEHLRESMVSILNQTVSTNDFVLVCDGPLNQALDMVINDMQKEFGSVLNVIRLEKNSGLGNALNEGLKYCKNEIIARMDSDDIAFKDRCERQLKCFEDRNDISIVSGSVLEFEQSVDKVTGKRKVPLTYEEICIYSRRRNPFNHPAVMIKKCDVELVGGYSEQFPLFEDYYLWIRMLKSGCKAMNLEEPLLYMRTPSDMYKRRGGVEYAKTLLRFFWWMYSVKWSGFVTYVVGAVPHALVCVMPNEIRKWIYKILHH